MTINRSILLAALVMSAVSPLDARQSPEAIARAIVIGQAYVSKNVYVAGFVEDEKRAWPPRIQARALKDADAVLITADFFRTVTQDSEEQYYFPQRERTGDEPVTDLFSTMDRAALEDRNLARYRAAVEIAESRSIFGWDDRLSLDDVSDRDSGKPRPMTAAERREVDADKKSRPTADCSTEPQFLDSAKVLLTARVAKTSHTIRLSTYATPGCAGHLSEIYVLDVLTPGQEPRRFEFRHYQGVL